MTFFDEIERPPRTRQPLDGATLAYDQDLEIALRTTLTTGKAIKVPLARFHSSPAKLRLWKEGLALRHRVLPDREFVAAWLEQAEEVFVGVEESGGQRGMF